VIHVDTSFLVDAIRESRRSREGRARRWLAMHSEETLAVSVFVLCELLVGAQLHAEPEVELVRVRETCAGLRVVEADQRLPATYARLRAGVTGKGPLATMDLLIASVAVIDGAPLLTGNGDHFDRIPELRVLSY
jgi:predicted nucleic acid-binding protein